MQPVHGIHAGMSVSQVVRDTSTMRTAHTYVLPPRVRRGGFVVFEELDPQPLASNELCRSLGPTTAMGPGAAGLNLLAHAPCERANMRCVLTKTPPVPSAIQYKACTSISTSYGVMPRDSYSSAGQEARQLKESPTPVHANKCRFVFISEQDSSSSGSLEAYSKGWVERCGLRSTPTHDRPRSESRACSLPGGM